MGSCWQCGVSMDSHKGEELVERGKGVGVVFRGAVLKKIVSFELSKMF